MRLSLLMPYAGDPRDWIKLLPDLEAAGLDLVWIPEAYSYDAISIAGAAVTVTSTMEVATGIVNVYSRTPALPDWTSSAAAGSRWGSGRPDRR
jgi:alkanesulfonate monooxygenase SsuD/methylene tetrahydromethanopterin reductase-like flavin-dependent oxidoreductase (luciferase family)